MACRHKFHHFLSLNNLDFEPTTLIVGTFNSGWVNLNNNATWFYGRIRNNYFWDVFPRIYENLSLRDSNPCNSRCSRSSTCGDED